MSDDKKAEIISDFLEDTDPSETGEGAVVIDYKDPKVCQICGYTMETIQPCHLRCPNCGATQDCSEKGLTW